MKPTKYFHTSKLHSFDLNTWEHLINTRFAFQMIGSNNDSNGNPQRAVNIYYWDDSKKTLDYYGKPMLDLFYVVYCPGTSFPNIVQVFNSMRGVSQLPTYFLSKSDFKDVLWRDTYTRPDSPALFKDISSCSEFIELSKTTGLYQY